MARAFPTAHVTDGFHHRLPYRSCIGWPLKSSCCRTATIRSWSASPNGVRGASRAFRRSFAVLSAYLVLPAASQVANMVSQSFEASVRVEWSRTCRCSRPQLRSSTSRRCECSQGSRVRHGSFRSRRWATKAGHEAALRRVKDQDKSGVSPGRAPVQEVMFEAARVRVQKLEAALLAMADFPVPEVDVLQAVLTRQSCRGPTSIGCAGDSVPTVHRADCEAHRGAGQSARRPSPDGCRNGGNGCNDCSRKPLQVHKPFQIVPRPRTWHQKWFVCKIRLPTSRHSWQRGLQKVSLPQWFAPTTPTRRFHVSDSGGTQSVDRCEAIRHSAHRHHRQCNRSQQVGRFDGRRNRS